MDDSREIETQTGVLGPPRKGGGLEGGSRNCAGHRDSMEASLTHTLGEELALPGLPQLVVYGDLSTKR